MVNGPDAYRFPRAVAVTLVAGALVALSSCAAATDSDRWGEHEAGPAFSFLDQSVVGPVDGSWPEQHDQGADALEAGGGTSDGSPTDATSSSVVDSVAREAGSVDAGLDAAVPCGGLGSGASLLPGQTIISCAGTARLSFQADGNLVVYRTSDNQPLWSSKTTGRASTRLTLDKTGNLVIYDGAAIVWESKTWGAPGARLAMQDDCNLVLYSVDSVPLAQAQTYGCVVSPLFGALIGSGVQTSAN